MRFKITLSITNKAQRTLFRNYQYDLSEWLAKTINRAPGFSTLLHQLELKEEDERFQYYTFSNLLFGNFSKTSNGYQINDNEIVLYVSFIPIKELENPILELFQQKVLELEGEQNKISLKVSDIQTLPEPEFQSGMSFKTLSPIILSYRDHTATQYSEYMYPKGERFTQLFFVDLETKYKIFRKFNLHFSEIEDQYSYDLKLTSHTRSAIVAVKALTPEEAKLQGYMFNFDAQAPVDLLRAGYYLGFGEKNAIGFGCCELNS